MNYFFQYIFSGTATLLAGTIAWIIYLYGKRDKKIEAATILLKEIHSAEREIENIKKNKVITDYSSILPSNHWEYVQHLFVRTFDTDELGKVTEFFKSCYLAEESLKLIRSYLPISMDQKTRSIQEKLIQLIADSTDKTDYEAKKKKILDLFHAENYWFLPNTPAQKVIDYIHNIDQLSLSPVGIKLKKIRDAKWYKITI
jgi:hypothetical protein